MLVRPRAIFVKLFIAQPVFVAVWAVAVLFWRQSGDTPSAVGAVLVLAGLPVALICGFVGLKKGFDAAARRRASNQDGEAEPQDATDADSGDAEGVRALALIASAIRMPDGANAAELTAAVRDNISPGLHATLVDHHGLPVYAATVDTADPETVVTAWDVVGSHCSEALEPRHRRALTLAAEVLDELVAHAQSRGRHPASAETVALQAVVFLPDDWSEATQVAGRGWLQQHANRSIDGEFRLHITTQSAVDSGQLLAAIDHMRVALNRRKKHGPRVVVACDSRIDEGLIQRWSITGRLRACGNEDGQIPGEGAAGLLLAWPTFEDHGAKSGKHEPVACMYRVARHVDEWGSSAGQPANESSANALVTEAIANGGQNLDAVSCIVTDADARPGAALTLARIADSTLTDGHAMEGSYSLGSVVGECGGAAALAGIAVAASQARERQAPVVFVSLADSNMRTALVVAPPITDF